MERATGIRPLTEWLEIAATLNGESAGSPRGIARTMQGWCELIRLRGGAMSHAERLDCERALGILHRRLTSGGRSRAAAPRDTSLGQSS
jgi:hypothetical protein